MSPHHASTAGRLLLLRRRRRSRQHRRAGPAARRRPRRRRAGRSRRHTQRRGPPLPGSASRCQPEGRRHELAGFVGRPNLEGRAAAIDREGVRHSRDHRTAERGSTNAADDRRPSRDRSGATRPTVSDRNARCGGVISGSVHVPLAVLYWRLDPTSGHAEEGLRDRDRQFILISADGYSSSLAAATPRDLGFARATDLAGGFNGWASGGMPVDRLSSR